MQLGIVILRAVQALMGSLLVSLKKLESGPRGHNEDDGGFS